jgi:hypothetical protein
MIKPKKKPEIKLLRRITPMRKKRQQQSMKCLRSYVTFFINRIYKQRYYMINPKKEKKIRNQSSLELNPLRGDVWEA